MWMHLLLLSALSGVVLDENGRPIEAAVLVLFPGNFGQPTTAISGEAGRFEITLVKPGPYFVEAYAPGYVPFRARDVDPEKPLAIVLRRGGDVITGVVRDGATLEVIPGATVETRSGESSAWVFDEPRLGIVEAVSDERGEFRLEGLAKHSYAVSASAPGYGRTTKSDASPGQALELYLFPGSGLYGRVLDEEGEPVEGALVAAEAENWMSPPGTAQRSDAEGRFAILGLEPNRYRLFVNHPDFAPLVREVELAEESDAEVELVLTRGVALVGRLLDENDERVSGKVSLRELDSGPVSLMMRSRLRVETGADGSFSLGPVPPGAHTLLVEARGYAAKNVEAPASGRSPVEDLGDIILETGLTISGRVVDERGSPVVSAVVNAAQPARGMLSAAGDELVVVETDGEGRFVLAGLSPGAHNLNATAPGYGQTERLLVEAGASGLVLTLKRAGSIRGTVVDPEGRAVTSFQAMARSHEHRGTGGMPLQDVEGVFLLEDIEEGEYAVEIVSRNFLPEVISSVRVSGGNVTDVGAVRLRRGGIITGTVVDASKEPVPGATVEVVATGPRIYWERTVGSDGKGRFRIQGLNDGKVALVASHPSYAAAHLDGVEVDSRSGPTDVELVMNRGGALEGVVRTRDGTDIAGLTIEVHPQGALFRRWARERVRTSEDGSFRIENLPKGRVTVGLQHSEANATFTVMSREVEIAEGETSYLEFEWRHVFVQGQVRRGGAPLSGAEIELSRDGPGFGASYGGVMMGSPLVAGPRYLMGMSGRDGYYELFVAEPGEYSVSASAYGVGLPWRRVTIPDVDSLTLDLDFGGALVSGRVIDKETEAPLAGAFVNAHPATPSSGNSGAGLQVGPDGLFELELEPGEFTFEVRAEGYATREEKVRVDEGGRSDLVFALSTGLRITGRVVDENGRGLGNARVIGVEDTLDISTPPVHVGGSRTLPDGSFALDELSRERFNVLAVGETGRFAFLASVPSGTKEVELVLRHGGKVEILVVDPEGKPIANAIAGLVAIEGRKARGPQGRADEGGRLELPVPQGNLTIKAVAPDGAEALRAVSVSEGEIERVEIVIARRGSPPRD